MTRALKYDIPGPDWRVSADALRAAARGGWERIFAPELEDPKRLVLDLGCGRGEFLAELAQREPDAGFIGVERSFKRVLKLARRLARSELRNVRLVQATAEQALGDLLPRACADEVWINFPDPWPKKRHHRRRLLQPEFVASLRWCLRPAGVVHVATDHAEYAVAIDEVLCATPGLENLYAPDRFRRELPGRTPTAYELEWRAEGRALHYFAYRRSA